MINALARRRRRNGFAYPAALVPSVTSVVLYLVALGFGVAVHYSIMLTLAAVSFWIVRAQGLVYGYFNFLHIARYPDVIFPRLFRFIFGWIIPVVIVANIPARLLIKPLGAAGVADVSSRPRGIDCLLVVASFLAFRPPALFQRQLVNKRLKSGRNATVFSGRNLPLRASGKCP